MINFCHLKIFFMRLLLICTVCNVLIIPAMASDKSNQHAKLINTSKNVETTQSLLGWMHRNLNKESNFKSEDIEQFFASKFIIDTNGKIVNATPMTYRDYLYKFKNNIVSVRYSVQHFIDANDYVIVPFIIYIKNMDNKLSQRLRVIAIFQFDEKGRIIMWQEVFSKT